MTGSFQFAKNDFWFFSGLLLLILLSVIDQPFFSKDANIFMNGVAGLISLIAVPVTSRHYLWAVFLCWTMYLIISSYLLMFHRSKTLSEENRLTVLVSRLNREIGKPEALFSAFFLWGVFQQFTPNSNEYKWLLLFWAIFIILNIPSVAASLSNLFTKTKKVEKIYAGLINSFSSPRVFECILQSDCPTLVQGASIGIYSGDEKEVAIGRVIDDRILNQKRMARMAIVETKENWRTLALPEAESRTYLKVIGNEISDDVGVPVGVVGAGSNIGILKLFVHPDMDLVEGEVLSVDLSKNRKAYYQIVGASLKETAFESHQSIQEIEVTASQLGIWDNDRSRFEPVSWVAPSGSLVFRVSKRSDENYQIPQSNLILGSVPNSKFPVHANLDDIVTHNTALIGVTGSGKSYLGFWLIEGLIKSGIKVLVLDISRQYWIFLKGHKPFPIKTENEIDQWLKTDQLIGIHQYASSTSYPKTTADIVYNVFKHLESTVKLKPGSNEPARICVVFEEAHSLIPEWNQVAQQGDTNQVNRTARTILQGRKYGLGCVVISQRTANVTKTILNQCNTILALQSFDQTGLDFLSNYMGSSYANTISTLPTRHAVLVGKASSSTRPILFSIQDLSGYWVNGDEEGSAITQPENSADPKGGAAD